MRVRTAAAAACLLLTACSQYDIKYDYDLDSNFAAYRTYAWIPQQIDAGGTSANVAMQRNTLLDKRVREAVDANLAAKGLTKNEETPDLRVVYHTGMQNKVDVTDWVYSYAGSYWGWAGRDIDVYNYTEGTLIVDLVKSDTKALTWRGSATGVVDPGRSPEQVQETINEVVAKIFENYPPKSR
jgi:hypothetical protein